MNEIEFAIHILEKFKRDKIVSKWYETFMWNTPMNETIDRISNAIKHNELTLTQGLELAVFIGLSTDLGDKQ